MKKLKYFTLIFGTFSFLSVNAQNISTAEYFFDTDPGVGNGTAITVTPGSNININQNISTVGLGEGFHNIFVRVKDENNTWSLHSGKRFFIQPANTTNPTLPNITAAEYYFDTDPGVGNGTAIIVTPGSNININQNISTVGLGEGFHNVFVRVKDENNTWSLYSGKRFFIHPANTTNPTSPNITAAEYFFDTDPGTGNGTAITISPGATISETFDIPTNSLSEGNYKIYIRFKDENDQWGLFEGKEFEVLNSTGVISTDISTQIRIYPNPAHSVLLIKGIEPHSKITIRDVHGKELLNSINIDNQIDIRNYPQGIYNLTITNVNYIFTTNFVKQ